MEYIRLLSVINEEYKQILHENLAGIYIHGSIGFGCFDWNRSDIDFIVVVEKSVQQQVKLKLLNTLENLCGQAPEKGFEMSVVLKEHCKNFIYPTPYELHFSNDWRLKKYLENPLLLSAIETDYDLAAHFTVIKNVGIVLCGEPISEVFENIPKEYYLDSIRKDVENAKENVIDNPVCTILNLCRVYAYMKDGLVLSKEKGGQWGLDNLPEKYRRLISEMIDSYVKGAALCRNKPLQIDFCEYMLKLISDYAK